MKSRNKLSSIAVEIDGLMPSIRLQGNKELLTNMFRRSVRDLPLFGLPCLLEIELAQVWIGNNHRRIVSISVEKFPPVSVQKFPHSLVG